MNADCIANEQAGELAAISSAVEQKFLDAAIADCDSYRFRSADRGSVQQTLHYTLADKQQHYLGLQHDL